MLTDVLTRRPNIDESLSLRVKDIGIPVAQVFPQAHASIYFAPTVDIPMIRTINPERDPFHHRFKLIKSLMLRMAIFFASQNGIPVGLRGSTLDQYLIANSGNEQNNLFLLKKSVNQTRGIGATDCAITFPMDQGLDDIHDPGNPDIRFGIENGSDIFLEEFADFLRMSIPDINSEQSLSPSEGSIRRNGKGSPFLEAWRLKKPKVRRSLTLGMKADGSKMPILRFRCIQDRLGGPAEKSVVLNGAYSLAEVRRMYELQPEDFTISPNELGSISFTGYSAGDRRKVDRCFNLDALVAEMKLGDPNISGQGLINAISLMQVYVNLPEIPRDLSISQEAIAFYEEGIKNGDPEFIDAWFEVVIRGIRKAVNLGVNQYEERSMQETKRLCSIAAERWVQGSHDSHTLIKNFRELEVAMTVYRNKTTSLMDIMGIRPLFQLAFKQYGMSESKSVSLDHMKSLIQ